MQSAVLVLAVVAGSILVTGCSANPLAPSVVAASTSSILRTDAAAGPAPIVEPTPAPVPEPSQPPIADALIPPALPIPTPGTEHPSPTAPPVSEGPCGAVPCAPPAPEPPQGPCGVVACRPPGTTTP